MNGSAPNLQVRRATIGDMELLWHWVSDPETRASAFETEPTPWAVHRRWFGQKMRSADCAIWILTGDKGIPMGQVRYDKVGNGADVDISIAPEHRGKRLAVHLIRMTLPLIASIWSPGYVEAHVKVTNIASQKTFRHGGFFEKERCPLHGACCVLFVWEGGKDRKLR